MKVIKHHFIGGVYGKELLIPDGEDVVSHKHNFDHMSVLAKGCVIVEVGGTQSTYYAPAVIEIKAGIEHSVLAVNGDAHWLCIHATEETDETKIDETLTATANQKMNMQKLPCSFDVSRAIEELLSNAWLWNKHRFRTASLVSPHREVNDIFLRYKSPDLPVDQSKSHDSVWYNAIRQLPAIRSIIESIMIRLPKAELGGVLITRIPPGCQVYPHSDAGTWHSEYFRDKILVLLQSHPDQSFNFEGESHHGIAGEVFSFDNMPEHWVINNSGIDRISLLMAIRTLPHEQLQETTSFN